MKITIEIENEDELKKLKKILKDQNITVIENFTTKNNNVIEEIMNRFNVSLPADYYFSRAELHER
jgi:hypothetical protein